MLVTLTVICAVGVALVLAAEGRPKLAWPGGIAKMIASTAFLGVAWQAGAFSSGPGIAIFVGLALSWWGDLFLIFRAKPIFLAGLISFFGGHVAYIAAFALAGLSPLYVGIGVAVVVALGVPVLLWLVPKLTEMHVPVYAYMLVISAMVALSAGAWGATGNVLLPVGAFLFYISDICVARDRFVAPGSINRYIGLPLYYGGQLVLAWSPLFWLEAPSPF
jgi:uncharacterized membrane protein YhhN